MKAFFYCAHTRYTYCAQVVEASTACVGQISGKLNGSDRGISISYILRNIRSNFEKLTQLIQSWYHFWVSQKSMLFLTVWLVWICFKLEKNVIDLFFSCSTLIFCALSWLIGIAVPELNLVLIESSWVYSFASIAVLLVKYKIFIMNAQSLIISLFVFSTYFNVLIRYWALLQLLSQTSLNKNRYLFEFYISCLSFHVNRQIIFFVKSKTTVMLSKREIRTTLIV